MCNCIRPKISAAISPPMDVLRELAQLRSSTTLPLPLSLGPSNDDGISLGGMIAIVLSSVGLFLFILWYYCIKNRPLKSLQPEETMLDNEMKPFNPLVTIIH